MATKKSNKAKAAYKDRLIGLIDDHKSVIIMTIENISSSHIQRFRKQIRGRAEMLFGKNV